MNRVLIVEDQKLTREYLENYVDKLDGFCVCGSIVNASMAEIFCETNDVDMVLMDVCTQHDEDGIDACAVLKRNFPSVKVIIITSMIECGFIKRAKNARADSFWYKDEETPELDEVMKRTAAGESVYPDSTPTVKIGLADSSEFTNSELKVLRLVAEGMSYDEMAQRLSISVGTVKYHITNMLQKTGFTNKTRLAIAVTNKKLIIPKPDGTSGL